MAKGYSFFVHGQNSQSNQYYEIKNNLFMDCGMKGQVVIGFNGGVASGYPAWGVFGNAFNYEGLDSSADEIANDTNGKIQNTIAGVMNFNDVSAGDFGGIFNLAANVSAPKSLGDPRWTISYMESSTPDPGTDPNPDTQMGDVDGNGEVNVTDVVLMIDYILGKNPKTFNTALADVNGDGTISVTDVVMVIDIVLGKR